MITEGELCQVQNMEHRERIGNSAFDIAEGKTAWFFGRAQGKKNVTISSSDDHDCPA
jgi:hypothetical protein